MIPKDKADLRLNCLYAAITVMGVNSIPMKGKKQRPTTEDVLVEAKKLSEWVLGKKGGNK